MHFVFDFAGVLFQWQPARLVQRTLPQRATDAGSASAWVDAIFQGYGGDWGEFDRGTMDASELVHRIARRTGLAPSEAQAVVDAVPHELQPVPETVALVRRLREAGQRLFYLSNMPLSYAEHLERTHDVIGWFESGVISARVRQIKPEPEIFVTAQRRFGLPPSQLVFVDDVAVNVQAAREAGWQALQFIDAADCEARLRAHGWWPVP